MADGGHKFHIDRRAYLDSDERKSYLDAPAILRSFRIRAGMRIADVGAGTGFFALPAARLVGRAGHVDAVDLAPEMLEDLQAKLVREGIRNVTPARSTEERIPLPDAAVDFVLLACVLHELDGAETLLESHRILRPRGVLGIVDWKKEDMEFGPPKAHRLDEDEAKAILRDAGFRPTRNFDAGPYHYAIEARIRRP